MKGQWRRKIEEECSVVRTVYLEEMPGNRSRGKPRK